STTEQWPRRSGMTEKIFDPDIEFCGEEQNWYLDRYTTPEQWREVWPRLTPSDRAHLTTLARLILGAAERPVLPVIACHLYEHMPHDTHEYIRGDVYALCPGLSREQV